MRVDRKHLALFDTPVFGLVTLPKGCYCVCLDEQTATDDGAAYLQLPSCLHTCICICMLFVSCIPTTMLSSVGWFRHHTANKGEQCIMLLYLLLFSFEDKGQQHPCVLCVVSQRCTESTLPTPMTRPEELSLSFKRALRGRLNVCVCVCVVKLAK